MTLRPLFALASLTALVAPLAALGACSEDGPVAASDAGAGGDSAPAVVCPTPTGEVTHSAGPAAGATETWAAGVVHQVPSSLSVAGALVIAPCAVVRLGAGATIDLRETGTLVAGDPADRGRVRFERAQSGAPWGAITTVYGRPIALHHADLVGGGSEDPNWQGPLQQKSNTPDDGAPPVRTLLVDDVIIDGSEQYGVALPSEHGFAEGSVGLVVKNTKKAALLVGARAAETIPTGDYTQAGVPAIEVGQTIISRDVTWSDRGVPYQVPYGDLRVRNRAGGLSTFTLRAGVTVAFTQGSGNQRIGVGDSSTATTPDAAFVAEGTADRPITLRAAGTKGGWSGVTFWGALAPASHLANVIVEDTGGDDTTTGLCLPEFPGAPKTLDTDSAAIRFFLAGTNLPARADLLRAVTIRNAAANGVIAYPLAPQDFCATNRITADLCAVTPFLDGDGRCPAKPTCIACP